MTLQDISIRGAREHNLKNLNLDIPRNALVVITGVSGSGKSSLAFDTLYAEGQRRYVESLSAYARQFLDQLDKPDCDSIEGLSPAIAIDQKSTDRNPRSTVGTVTEIYDYLRLLYARTGVPFCPQCGAPILPQTLQDMMERVLAFPEGSAVAVLSPMVRGRKGIYQKELDDLREQGFARIRIDGEDRDLSETIKLDRQKKHTIEVFIDRLKLKAGISGRLQESLETALKLAQGVAFAEVTDAEGKIHPLAFNLKAACGGCGANFVELEPRLFSFNSTYGACPHCEGMGILKEFDPELLIPDPTVSIADGAIKGIEERFEGVFQSLFAAIITHYGGDPALPFQKLSQKIRQALLHGTGDEKITYPGKVKRVAKKFAGLIDYLTQRYRETDRESLRETLETYMVDKKCSHCAGKRLRPEALAVQVSGISIDALCAQPIVEALQTVKAWRLTPRQLKIGERVLKEIRERLQFLIDVGLDYLSIDRAANTLSGGEGQRIRLATQIGSQLVGVLYILDEPSIGLHPRDNQSLLENLMKLRDAGNTVLVVEHDEDTMRRCDYILDMGPGAGVHGGELVAAGTPAEIMAAPQSLTGRFLSGKDSIAVPVVRRTPQKFIRLRNAHANNLKNVDVQIPLESFVCVTGVSGSGKSTLVNDTLYEWFRHRLYSDRDQAALLDDIEGGDAIDQVIMIDQAPIGRTPRSNPATYIGIFSLIRDLFAQLPEAKLRGWKPGRFSFNVPGGRCESCQGAGMKKIEMHFLPNIFVRCDVCNGKRYGQETLEVRYRGASIAEVLDMTVSEALQFFDKIPLIKRKMAVVEEVGLGYITLGQSATTLSGGEAQRMKLAKELAKRSTGKTLYILDEPTTGLHFSDVRQLLAIFQRFVEQKNTVLVIEHHLDVIKSADWVIDLGPEGGNRGGEIVAAGTPEQVAASPRSLTGRFLKAALQPDALLTPLTKEPVVLGK